MFYLFLLCTFFSHPCIFILFSHLPNPHHFSNDSFLVDAMLVPLAAAQKCRGVEKQNHLRFSFAIKTTALRDRSPIRWKWNFVQCKDCSVLAHVTTFSDRWILCHEIQKPWNSIKLYFKMIREPCRTATFQNIKFLEGLKFDKTKPLVRKESCYFEIWQQMKTGNTL